MFPGSIGLGHIRPFQGFCILRFCGHGIGACIKYHQSVVGLPGACTGQFNCRQAPPKGTVTIREPPEFPIGKPREGFPNRT